MTKNISFVKLSSALALAATMAAGAGTQAQVALTPGLRSTGDETAIQVINRAQIRHDLNLASVVDQAEFFKLIRANAARHLLDDPAEFTTWWVLQKSARAGKQKTFFQNADWQLYFTEQYAIYKHEAFARNHDVNGFVAWIDSLLHNPSVTSLGHSSIKQLCIIRKATVGKVKDKVWDFTIFAFVVGLAKPATTKLEDFGSAAREFFLDRITPKEAAAKASSSAQIKAQLGALRDQINSPEYDFTMNSWADNSNNLKDVHADVSKFFGTLPKKVKSGRQMLIERANHQSTDIEAGIQAGTNGAETFRQGAIQALGRISELAVDKVAVRDIGEQLYEAIGESIVSDRLQDKRLPAIEAQITGLENRLLAQNATISQVRAVTASYKSMFQQSASVAQTLTGQLYHYTDFDKMLENMKRSLALIRNSPVARDGISVRVLNCELAIDLTDYLNIVEQDIDSAMKIINESRAGQKSRKVLNALDKANDSVVTERAKAETGRAGEKETPESIVKHAAFEAAKK